MDIVFLTTSLERGGAETQLVRTAISLKQRGWEVGILTMLPSTDFLDEIRDANIPLEECASARTRFPWRMALRMTRQLRRWHPTILVTVNYPADAMGRICGRLAGVPTIIASVLTAHVKTSLREKFYRFTEPLIALTVSNSKAAVTYMVSRRILSLEKTVIIPNGMIVSDFPAQITREEARRELAIPLDAFLWIAVGNLRPAKDYPTLLEAAARCAKASAEFRLCIVGGGEALADLNADVDARGLRGVVSFLGPRTDVPRVLRAGDAFVLSSAWEGLPNAVMEGMASGLPVVATDVGGVRELIDQGRSGFIVPPSDPTALAVQMLAMMSLEVEARSRMGASARAYIISHFDNERVVDMWEEVFGRGTIGTRKPRPVQI